jgi:hypothetical protein
MEPRIRNQRKNAVLPLARGSRCRDRVMRLLRIAGLSVLVLASYSLTGCGRLSLQELLESEQPGAFFISPGNANLQVGRSMVVKANGGFTPYTYEFLTPGIGTFDEQTLIYTAPASLGGPLEEVEIEAEDSLGNTDRVKLKIYVPLRLDPAESTLVLGAGQDFTASGGVPDPGTGDYIFVFDGVAADIQVISSATVRLTPSATGSYTLGVTDSIGNYTAAGLLAVTASTLAVSPTAAVVKTGGTVIFAAVVPAGDTFIFSADAGSFAAPSASPAVYTAPGTAGVDTVTLTDTVTSQSVTATVYVQAEEPEALYVIPSYTEVLIAEHVDLAAGGGMGPYTFRFKPDTDPKGTLSQTGPYSAVYTAPDDLPARDQIMVEDAAGSPPVYAVVKVSKK